MGQAWRRYPGLAGCANVLSGIGLVEQSDAADEAGSAVGLSSPASQLIRGVGRTDATAANGVCWLPSGGRPETRSGLRRSLWNTGTLDFERMASPSGSSSN